MTSRTTSLTLDGEKKAFRKALNDAITIGANAHGTALTTTVRRAINAVADEFPSPTDKTIQNAKDTWADYLTWRASP